MHGISLPPGEYGGDGITRLFTNRLDPRAHPYYAAIAAMNDPAVKKRMLDQGLEIVASTPEAFTAYQAREFARWKTVIETRKITAD